MMRIYLTIFKNKFYLYNEEREPLYVEGEPFFAYETNKMREAVIRMVESIFYENNLSSKNDLQFFVIDNSDAIRNESLSRELGSAIVKNYSLNDLLKKLLTALSRNPKLYVNELGINYDGECYRMDNGLLTQSEYSLLALSIEPSELLKFVE